MAIRTFTKPSSLDSKIALATIDQKMASISANQSDGSPKSSGKNQGVTYAFQEQLPKLPVPELESTCQKYLESLRPLQTPKEHQDSKVAVKEFLKYEGPKLQEKLQKYAQGKANYIEQFCELTRHSKANLKANLLERVRFLLELR